jgi:hypothetical protein
MENIDDPERKPRWRGTMTGHTSVLCGLGLIGAVIYYVQHAAGFWAGCAGIVKAIFWPALLVYKLLENLKM